MAAARINTMNVPKDRTPDPPALHGPGVLPAEAHPPSLRPPGRTRSPAREQPAFRFSGHQTFPLRLSWLPKAVAAISKGVDPLTDIDLGITRLGLGKNMVEALRCWIEAFQVANKKENGWELTPVGLLVFDPKTGADPFVEDHTTAWLLHWLICTDEKAPFFAWDCLFNRWPAMDFSASQVQSAFRRESDQTPRPASPVTLTIVVAIFAIVLVAPGILNTQTATLAGVVADSSGAVVPGTTITVKNADTGSLLQLPPQPIAIGGASLCFGIRMMAIYRHWHFPIARTPESPPE